MNVPSRERWCGWHFPVFTNLWKETEKGNSWCTVRSTVPDLLGEQNKTEQRTGRCGTGAGVQFSTSTLAQPRIEWCLPRVVCLLSAFHSASQTARIKGHESDDIIAPLGVARCHRNPPPPFPTLSHWGPYDQNSVQRTGIGGRGVPSLSPPVRAPMVDMTTDPQH